MLSYSCVQLIVHSDYLVYNNIKPLLHYLSLLRALSTEYKPDLLVT